MCTVIFILVIVAIVTVSPIIMDIILCNKFKPGYTFERYKTEFIALDTYDLLDTYEIVAQKEDHICVKKIENGVISDKIIEFNIHRLLAKTDKIIIKDKDGNIKDTLYKIEDIDYE